MGLPSQILTMAFPPPPWPVHLGGMPLWGQRHVRHRGALVPEQPGMRPSQSSWLLQIWIASPPPGLGKPHCALHWHRMNIEFHDILNCYFRFTSTPFTARNPLPWPIRQAHVAPITDDLSLFPDPPLPPPLPPSSPPPPPLPPLGGFPGG